jgi:NAD(P)-dependent dehydrogenase (short-subunit alcohol dehydrogenase family)
MKRLSDKRILVVGASSGIGRAAAGVLAGEGARLAVAARRVERLEEVAQEVAGGAVVVPCDVRDPEACAAAVAQAVRGLGGLDALVYVAGIAPFRPLVDADAEVWRSALEVNVIGASLVTRAALPHLVESRGRALYVSSIAALDHPPRRGLSLYVTSKAALDKLVALWQVEHPEVGFTRVSAGDTGSTEIGAGWDAERGGELIREWIAKGFMFGRAMRPESVGRHLADLLASEEAVPVSIVVPRYGRD